jgi:hypothetical protein
MLRPVGSQPPSVYWRRRLLLAGSVVLVIVLLVVTVRALTSSDNGSANAGGTGTPTPQATRSSSTPPRSSPRPTSASAAPKSSASKASGSTASGAASSGKSSVPPAVCRTSDLSVSAVVASPTYKVGATPMLELQVTNVGRAPCVQDLADKQIVLKVYNGESRVWGSHDCETQPGTALRTLTVNNSVRVTITWSGFTSRPNDCKSRQRVGAGTYTLYATLSGKTGKAAQFTIS